MSHMEKVIARSGLEERFFNESKPIIEDLGYTLFDLEYITRSTTLRVYIMDPQTRSAVIEDCVKIDHALNDLFEQGEWIPDDVVLEVSSPGVYRKLRSWENLKGACGELVTLNLSKGVKVQGRETKALKQVLLEDVNEAQVEVSVNDEKVSVSFSDIKKASVI